MKQCGHPLVDNVVTSMPAAVYGACKLCGELVTARWNTSKGWLAEDRLREKWAEKECQHDGSLAIVVLEDGFTYHFTYHIQKFRCAKCGVKLTPTWGVE